MVMAVVKRVRRRVERCIMRTVWRIWRYRTEGNLVSLRPLCVLRILNRLDLGGC